MGLCTTTAGLNVQKSVPRQTAPVPPPRPPEPPELVRCGNPSNSERARLQLRSSHPASLGGSGHFGGCTTFVEEQLFACLGSAEFLQSPNDNDAWLQKVVTRRAAVRASLGMSTIQAQKSSRSGERSHNSRTRMVMQLQQQRARWPSAEAVSPCVTGWFGPFRRMHDVRRGTTFCMFRLHRIRAKSQRQ